MNTFKFFHSGALLDYISIKIIKHKEYNLRNFLDVQLIII